MLKLLKALFGGGKPRAEAQSVATVPLAELEDWLRQSRSPLNARIVEQLAATRMRIDQFAATVREKVSVLQSAQLLNPDIPERAKDFMQGNREEYSRRVTTYLDKLVVPNATEQLGAFFDQHHKDAAEFTQGILRPFQILQEFFSHESKEITSLLAQMEQEIIALKALHAQANPVVYEAARRDIALIAIRRQQFIGLQRERADLEKQTAEAAHSVKALATEEERLLKDALRQEALGKVAEAQKRVQSHEQKVRNVFILLEPALRKFYRMATRHVTLVEKYLRDPVKTLTEDLHLDLLEVLSDIERLLTFDRLALGDKKSQVNEAMAILTKSYLGIWMREYGQVAKAEKDAQLAVEACEASKTLARIQRLREETRRNAQLNEQRSAQLKKDIERINVESLKKALEEKLKGATGTSVTVTF
jgi:hypothetical protein